MAATRPAGAAEYYSADLNHWFVKPDFDCGLPRPAKMTIEQRWQFVYQRYHVVQGTTGWQTGSPYSTGLCIHDDDALWRKYASKTEDERWWREMRAERTW